MMKEPNKDWFDGYLSFVLDDKDVTKLPPAVQKVGDVELEWWRVGDGEYFIWSDGGTSFDRKYLAKNLDNQLKACALTKTQVSVEGSMTREASWQEVSEKAKRLRDSGKVHMHRNGYHDIVATVEGDHGVYQVEMSREDPSSRVVTQWNCTCPWGQVSWGRTRQFKKFEGRCCSHALATYWTSLSTPLDEDVQPGTQMAPGERAPIPQQQQGIEGPGQPQGPPQGIPYTAPQQGQIPGQMQLEMGQPEQPMVPPDLIPKPITGPQPIEPNRNPGGYGTPVGIQQHEQQLLQEQEAAQKGQEERILRELMGNPNIPHNQFLTVSKTADSQESEVAQVPGQAWDMTEDSNILPPWIYGDIQEQIENNPSLFVDHMPAGVFSNKLSNFISGMTVALNQPVQGTWQGINGGGVANIPANSVGEVNGTDPSTGLVEVYFEGPAKQNKALEPHGAIAHCDPTILRRVPRR